MVAAVVLLILVVLVVLGVHSCQVSQRNSSLQGYSDNVSSLIQDSNQTGQQLFTLLSSGGSASNATNLQSQVNAARVSADSQLSRAKSMDAPGQVTGAQRNLLLALQMRRDGIADVAQQIQPALGSATSQDAVKQIAADMARFYSSDVVYKAYTLPIIASVLHGAGIAVGGANGQPFNSGQFLPDVQWLTPSYVARALHSSVSNGKGGGHALNSVSVGGTELQAGSSNTVTGNPPPTFTLNFTNTGQSTETNVVCKVTVSGTSIGGQAIIPQTTAGEQTTCQVALGSAPPSGSYHVTATVEPVPGEANTSNNSMTFPVTFH